MNDQTHSADRHALRLSREFPAGAYSGYPVLLVVLLSIAAGLGGVALGPQSPVAAAIVIALASLVFLLTISGFYLLQPNQAAALLLFGTYKGTDRNTGLRWRWPWLTRTKI